MAHLLLSGTPPEPKGLVEKVTAALLEKVTATLLEKVIAALHEKVTSLLAVSVDGPLQVQPEVPILQLAVVVAQYLNSLGTAQPYQAPSVALFAVGGQHALFTGQQCSSLHQLLIVPHPESISVMGSASDLAPTLCHLPDSTVEL